MKGKLAGAAVALLLSCGIAAAQPARRIDTRFETLSAVKDTTAGVVGQLSAELVRTTSGFVTAAGINDLYVVAASKIALQRARSPAVRIFARRMMETHTAAIAKLKRAIRYNNVNATLPGAVDARRRVMLDDLRGARAENFDHRYIAQQIAAHKETDILMRRYAKVGKINAMRDFAAASGKAEAGHLALARAADHRGR